MEASSEKQLGRNDPCHCGSGKKYKQCHLAKDEEVARAARAKILETAPAPAPEAEKAATASHHAAPPRHATQQPWKKSATNTRAFQRMSSPRKVGGS